VPPLFPLTAAGSAGVREERELARPPAPQATSATSPVVGDHRGAAEVRGIDRSQGPAPPSRYRLAKDRLADLMAAATELGLTKPTTTAFWYSRPLPGTVEVFDRFVPTGTGAAKGQWYYRMCSDMPRQELGDGLGCAAGAPSTALGGPLPFPRGRIARPWAAPDCPWTPSNARSMPTSYCDGDAANRAA